MAKSLEKFGGVPAGGTTGQALVKTSGTDNDVEWGTVGGSSLNAKRLNPVYVLGTANQSLTSSTVDSTELTNGQRAALVGQSDPAENGIWQWSSGTSEFIRPADFATGTDGTGCDFFVETGTYAGQLWRVLGAIDIDSEDTLLARFANVPAGGSDGQVLTKTSGSDYAIAWETPSGGGGGSPAVISESSDFTLDPAGDHPDGCKILLTPAAGTSVRFITLPVLASQPTAGYSITILFTGAGNLQVQSNDTANFVSSAGAPTVLVTISYVGSDIWSVASIAGAPVLGFITNIDL